VRALLRPALGGAVVLASALPALAHDGPPYPILVDHAIADCDLSIWADPDVGTGTFYFYINEVGRERPIDRPIRVRVQPTDGRLDVAEHDSELADDDEPFQRIAEVPFDARGTWSVEFVVAGPEDTETVELDVEVTPPGLGEIDVLWFLFPFLAIGFIWIKVVLKKREYERAASCESPPSTQSS